MVMFVMNGSQNLALLSPQVFCQTRQSLAGRTALVELLPLSIGELRAVGRLDAGSHRADTRVAAACRACHELTTPVS